MKKVLQILVPIVVILSALVSATTNILSQPEGWKMTGHILGQMLLGMVPYLLVAGVILVLSLTFLRKAIEKDNEQRIEDIVYEKDQELKKQFNEKVKTLRGDIEAERQAMFKVKELSKKIWAILNGQFEYKDDNAACDGPALFMLLGTEDEFDYRKPILIDPKCANRSAPCYNIGLSPIPSDADGLVDRQGLLCPKCGKVITRQDPDTFAEEAHNHLMRKIQYLLDDMSRRERQT